MARTRVVTSEQDFVNQLRDADILVFDKLASLNRLVQWGDNRPVGHCGVWHGGGSAVRVDQADSAAKRRGVFEATIKPAESGGKASGVFLTDLSDLLSHTVTDGRGSEVKLVRTVTAMRHRDIDDARRQMIVDYLFERTQIAEFAVQEMVLLTPFAVERAYAGGDQPLPEVMEGVVKACMLYARRTLAGLGTPERTFCSQLVYRAYVHAGLSIEICDPLINWYNAPRRGSGRRGDPRVTALFEEYKAFFEEEVLEGASAGSRADRTDENADLGQRRRGAEGTGPSAERQRGDQDVSRRSFLRPGRPPTFDEMITPGDFWSSPSLEPVAVLHRPPGT
jgi:hypothetical protein